MWIGFKTLKSLIFWRLDWWVISEINNIQLKKNYITSPRGQRLDSLVSQLRLKTVYFW